VIDHDLDTYNEIEHYEQLQDLALQSGEWVDDTGRTETGLWINHWPVGSAVLWAPFFLVAHSVTRVLGLSADGYSSLYVWLSMFASTFWALLGLLLVHRISKALYNDAAATLGVVSVWLASPLVFYMFMYPTMSHANDMFANALFVFVWYATARKRTPLGWVALGVAAGLAALVRTQNVLLVFPGLELLWQLGGTLRQRARGATRQALAKGALFAASFVVGFAPQMLVWKAVFGTYVVLNPIQISMGLGFTPWSPHFFHVLFSSNRGLFVWHPLLLLATVGVWFLGQRERRLAFFLAFSFLLQVYLVGSYDAWDSSPAFGARYSVNTAPMFALGLASLLNWLRRRVPFSATVAALGAFVLWNGALIVQYSLQLVPRAGPISIPTMVYNQFLVVPRRLGEVAALMLSRLRRQ
jgi:hypothetical protein